MKQAFKNSAVVVGLLLAGGGVAACPATLDEECANDACVAGSGTTDGGRDGDAKAPDASVPDGCIPEADTNSTQAKACVNDSFALFVDGAAGNNANPGSMAKPFKTITAAVNAVDS